MPAFIVESKEKVNNWSQQLIQLPVPITQSPVFNGLIMLTIFLNAVTIAMETTRLSHTQPTFFTATDNIFLGIYIMECALKVYAEPLGYWQNYYNLFDFMVLVISLVQSILTALEMGQTGLTVIGVVKGRREHALGQLRTVKPLKW